MPKKYEKMRDAFKEEGMGDKTAKTKAADDCHGFKKNGNPPINKPCRCSPDNEWCYCYGMRESQMAGNAIDESRANDNNRF